MDNSELTYKQAKFVELYNGNATETARLSGYSEKTAEQQGCRLLSNVKVSDAIRQRDDVEKHIRVADRVSRQKFWTKVMDDTDETMRERLKASELLGRSEADFIERRDIRVETDKRFDQIQNDAEDLVNRLNGANS
jgi:phage terminase small subunit